MIDPETIDIREDERLELDVLEPWLRDNLGGASGSLRVRQFGGGHANLTYLLDFSGREFVLRRPPLGPVAPSAHDMKREHRVLSRLWRSWDLAPRSFVLCTDTSILGCAFHVMERREGFVLRATNPERTRDNPDLCRRIGEMTADVLASFHQVDPAEVALDGLGRPEGFIERQIAGWAQRWEAALDDDAPDAGSVVSWLMGETPAPVATTLVHNDYKLDNILVSREDPAVPVAVLDWDMCTRGDPLLDLANLLTYWSEHGDSERWRTAVYMPTDAPGFPTRRELVERYAEKTGFDVSRISWYEVFVHFKTAVIVQQIYIRYLKGQTRDSRFAIMGDRVKALIEKCGELVSREQA